MIDILFIVYFDNLSLLSPLPTCQVGMGYAYCALEFANLYKKYENLNFNVEK